MSRVCAWYFDDKERVIPNKLMTSYEFQGPGGTRAPPTSACLITQCGLQRVLREGDHESAGSAHPVLLHHMPTQQKCICNFDILLVI